ncbi:MULTISPECIES: hypothetical protein [unclassified Spirillospora]|uniref:hypothetical protein n=1 Tax=unclassified Spirillospora TaxID=2642701 RepID=UPI00371E1A17
MIFGLGIILCAIGLPHASVPEQARLVYGGPAPERWTQPAGQFSPGPVRLAVEAAPAVLGSQRVAVGLAAAKAPVDWDETDEIKTVDGDPGGKLQWHPASGRVRVCDVEGDGKDVRGYVTRGGKVVATMRAGEKGKCDEPDSGYKLALIVKYGLKVCLGSDEGVGYCNTSDTTKWPDADRQEDYCKDNFSGAELVKCQGGDSPCDKIKGPAKEYCQRGTGERKYENVFPSGKPWIKPPPPGGSKKSINDRPEEELELRGHAENASEVAEPLRVLNGWLVWFALGACMLGFMLVGGNMALKHKRGEVGAHAANLGWVLLACLIAGSGLVMGLISLLFEPL